MINYMRILDLYIVISYIISSIN